MTIWGKKSVAADVTRICHISLKLLETQETDVACVQQSSLLLEHNQGRFHKALVFMTNYRKDVTNQIKR